MSFRYFLIDTSGDVTGTNDADALPSPGSSDDIVAVIDTQSGTYTNDDLDDEVIPEYEPDDLDDDNTRDDSLNT